MRISTTKSTVTLGRSEYRDLTGDARDAHTVRESYRRAARDLAARTGRAVEVYAPAAAGGHQVDEIEAEAD